MKQNQNVTIRFVITFLLTLSEIDALNDFWFIQSAFLPTKIPSRIKWFLFIGPILKPKNFALLQIIELIKNAFTIGVQPPKLCFCDFLYQSIFLFILINLLTCAPYPCSTLISTYHHFHVLCLLSAYLCICLNHSFWLITDKPCDLL